MADKIKNKAVRFLRHYQMDHLDVDFDDNVELLLEQMHRGLSGRKSSLEMIPTYISVEGDVPADNRVIVADAGGTNFRIATVYFDNQKRPVIEKLQKFRMPGIEREMKKDEFFKAMAAFFKDIAGLSKSIGFCFSYAVKMFPNKDGRLIRFSKEIKTRDVEGQLIGDNLNCAMDAIGLPAGKAIVILNDTVATLLAGVGYQNRSYGGYIGFILGTGTNCCYIESNRNIKKVADLDFEKSQIINTESGGFAKGHRGKLDIAFDKTTANPGVNKFEKMISGAYLGPLYMFIVHQACKDGLFSDKVSNLLGQIDAFETKDMNDFLNYPFGDNILGGICRQGVPEDEQILYRLADRLTERAAKLTAINLSAMAIKSGGGNDPARPICIVAEGTTFYNMKTLKSRVEYYLKQYLENKRGIYTDIINVENATLTGAAIAGLTN